MPFMLAMGRESQALSALKFFAWMNRISPQFVSLSLSQDDLPQYFGALRPRRPRTMVALPLYRPHRHDRDRRRLLGERRDPELVDRPHPDRREQDPQRPHDRPVERPAAAD